MFTPAKLVTNGSTVTVTLATALHAPSTPAKSYKYVPGKVGVTLVVVPVAEVKPLPVSAFDHV